MDISVEAFVLQIKKKIFYLAGFLLFVLLIQALINNTNRDRYDIAVKANFYEMKVLYSIIDMVNSVGAFANESQVQNFVYEFEAQIPKELEKLHGVKCIFETNLLTCMIKNVNLVDGEIKSLKIKLASNIKNILNNLFHAEVKLIQNKITSIEDLDSTLKKEQAGLDTLKNALQGSSLKLGLERSNTAASTFVKDSIQSNRVSNIVKIEELEYLKNTLISLTDKKDGIDFQILINRISLKKNTLLTFVSSLIFGLIVIFLTIPPKKI